MSNDYKEALRHYRTCMALGKYDDALKLVDIAIDLRCCEECLPELVRMRHEAVQRLPRSLWQRLKELVA